jgi:hypothetical protein
LFLADGPPLAPWLIASLGLAVASFLAGLFGPLGGYGPPGRNVAMLLGVSLALSFGWLIVAVVASIILRWRALWLLISAPGALFWPIIFMLLARSFVINPGRMP